MEGQRKHILVVDMDHEFLIDIERLLEDAGFATTITWDLREALELLTSKQFDAVLLGHHAPELQAADVLPRLQAVRKGPLYIVLQAGPNRASEREVFLSRGATAVLAKTITAEFAGRIRELIAQQYDPAQGRLAAKRSA